MKIVIFCEGHTEREVIAGFLSRWLNPRLTQRVGIKPVRFAGWQNLVADTARKADLHLRATDILGVVSLLDLYGPTFYPSHLTAAAERCRWGMDHMRKLVAHQNYRHHFAIHEVEAWILSQPDLLPSPVRKKLPGKSADPESVNFHEPPAKLLDRLYTETLKKGYKKVVEGTKLFAKLDPEVVYRKCPAFKALADDLLALCPEDIRRPAA